MLHWISHFFGIDTQSSPFYDFWSGAATQASLLIAAAAFIRHHNCHQKWCLRLGHVDPEHGHPACRKHHSQAHKLGGDGCST